MPSPPRAALTDSTMRCATNVVGNFAGNRAGNSGPYDGMFSGSIPDIIEHPFHAA